MWCPNDKRDFFRIPGQITLDGPVGQALVEHSKGCKNIVEIGTWNGLGSTRCFLSNLTSNFYTLESNKDKHTIAQENLKDLITPNVKFLHGSILKVEDVDVSIFPELSHPEFKRWHSVDMENVKNSPNVLSQLPEEIDFLLLDGGEFTTWSEFKILLPRCTKYIALDDVNVSKCKKIREELTKTWEEVLYIPERNGFSLFKKTI